MAFKKVTDKVSNSGNPERSEKGNYQNVCYLTGVLQGVWMRDDSAFFLLDVTGTQKGFVPCTLFGENDAALAERLDQFQKGDQISVTGFVRPWSQKVEDKWINKLEIRVTEIEAPKGQGGSSNSRRSASSDSDNVPF